MFSAFVVERVFNAIIRAYGLYGAVLGCIVLKSSIFALTNWIFDIRNSIPYVVCFSLSDHNI